MSRKTWIVLILAILLYYRWGQKPKEPAVAGPHPIRVLCTRCPTIKCPPSNAGDKFTGNDYYVHLAQTAGLDASKLSVCGNAYYYDGKFTCVQAGAPQDRCSSTNVCGAESKAGSADSQFQLIAKAVNKGIPSIACPLLDIAIT